MRLSVSGRHPLGFLLSLIMSVCLVVGLIVCICVSWAPLRDRLILEFASPYGVKSVQTELALFSFQPIELKQLSIRMVQSNAHIELEARRIELMKSNPSLSWFDANSWSVKIESLNLQFKEIAQPVNTGRTLASPGSFDPSDWLPKSLLEQVPLQSISINQYQINYLPDPENSWRVIGDGFANRDLLKSDFQITHNQRQFAGAIEVSPKQMNVLVGPKGAPWIKLNTRLEQANDDLVAGGVVELADLNELEDWVDLLPAKHGEQLLFQGALNIAFSATLPRSRVQAWIEKPNGFTFEGGVFNAHIDVDINRPSVLDFLNETSVTGSATIQVDGDKVAFNTIDLSEVIMNLNTSHESIKPIAQEIAGDSSDLTVDLMAKGNITGSIAKHDFQLKVIETRIDVKDADAISKLNIVSKQLAASIENGVLSRLIGATKFNASLSDRPVLIGAAKFAADRVDTTYIGHIEAQIEDLTSVISDFEYTPETRLLAFKLNSKRASLATETFNLWAEQLSVPLALDLGDLAITMEGKLDLNDHKGVSSIGRVLVEGWQGDIQKNHFSGLNSPFSFSGDLSKFSVSAEVTNGLFDIGLPITDIRYNLNIEGNLWDGNYKLKLDNLQGKLVGGTVRIPSIEWDSQKQVTQFHVVISDWQFSEMIQLLERDDIKVTGTLDGMLPIFIEKEGVLIKEGLLTARPPGGVIQYKPDMSVQSMLSAQQELKMATDILENFEYEQLDVILNQDIEFNQTLALTLKGKNPDVYGGTPVNLNLNIDHNILPLIQSLTLPGKVQENWQNLDKLQ